MAEQQANAEAQAQERAKAMAEAERKAAARQADEMPQGGRFLVDGVMVDSEGQPVKD